jgi:hypothetical protein
LLLVALIVALQGCMIVVSQGCVIVALKGCVILALQCCVIVMLHNANTENLRHRAVPSDHPSNWTKDGTPHPQQQSDH